MELFKCYYVLIDCFIGLYTYTEVDKLHIESSVLKHSGAVFLLESGKLMTTIVMCRFFRRCVVIKEKIFFLQLTNRREFVPKMEYEYEKPFAEEGSKKERKCRISNIRS